MNSLWKMGKFFGILILLLFPFGTGLTSAEELLPEPGKPLTLKQARAIALKLNPTLVASKEIVAANKALVEQALAAYYPQVNFNNSYTALTTNFSTSAASSVSGGVVPLPGGGGGRNRYAWNYTDIFSTGLTATQTIYDFGRTANNVKINRETVQASEEDVATTRLNIILNVDQAYYGVLATKALIGVGDEVVRQTKQRLDQAQGFYQAGTRPKIDVTKAEVDLTNAEQALIQAKNNYQVAQATLNNAIGIRQDLTFPINDELDFTPRPITLGEIVQQAYERRPEILKFKAQERAQEATVKLARATYYPILSGNATSQFRSTGFDQTFFWDTFLGASLNFPIFSGFSTPAQIAQAQATLRNLQAQEEALKLNIRLESETAYLGLQLATEQIRVTEKAVVYARENYELASGRYKVGVGQPLEITDAEVQLANSRANYITALYNFKVADAKIDKAMAINK
jgi:outer membrane protein TolC